MRTAPSDSQTRLLSNDVHPVRRSTEAVPVWWWGLLGLVLLACLPLLPDGGADLGRLLWVAAPFLAVAAWANAAHRATGRARVAFRVFQAAAVLASVGHLAWAYEARAGFPLGAGSGILFLLPHLAIGLGAVLTVGTSRRAHGWSRDLVADATLVLLVAVAAGLRLFIEPLLVTGTATDPGMLMLTTVKAAAVIPVGFAALVVLRRGAVLSPSAGVLLLFATLVFAVGEVGSLGGIGPGEALAPMTAADGPELLGWVLLACAGLTARWVPSTGGAMLARHRAPNAVRKLVVPAAALFLAFAIVDMGFGREPRPETVVAVALLAVVLAASTGRAFSIAEREAERVRQIEYTRVLVDVTHALAGTTELDDTLRIISESARDVFGTRGAGIELIVEDGTCLETRSAVGLPDDVVGLRFPVEGSFTGWVVRHGKPRATVDPKEDPYIQPQSLSFLGRSPVAAAPIQFRGETLGALFACIRGAPFDAAELDLMGAMAEQTAIAIQQARLFEQVTTLSVTDPLTGLANRRRLERALARDFAAAQRGRDLAVIIFDLDDFKSYNDAHGHLAGDAALKTFARTLAQETRAMNLVARYGGDEFVAILADSNPEGARVFIERVRIRFAAAVEELGHGPLDFSAGLAQYEPGMEDADALIGAADAELYRTKPETPA